MNPQRPAPRPCSAPGRARAGTAAPTPAPDVPRRRLVAGTASLSALCALGAVSAAPAALAADGERPAWPSLKLLDGSVLDPAALRGQAVVLVVWATHCPFCRGHNPHVEKLHRASAGRPLKVVTAALDRDPALVARYAREHGYTFPVTLEADALRARFGLKRVIPMTVTFDRTGRLLQRIPGEMFEEDVLALARLADSPA